MSFRSGIFMLATLAPAVAGCGAAKHFLPAGARPDVGRVGISDRESCLLPRHEDMSCAAFAVEGTSVSPPFVLEDEEVFDREEIFEQAEPERLPLTAPGSDETRGPERSILEPPKTTMAAGYELPAPVLVETEEDARVALALEAASLATAPRRVSTDVAVGPLREPIERDPPPSDSQGLVLPIVQPSPDLAQRYEPVRADYSEAPLAKVSRHFHLPHRRHVDGAPLRPGLIAGLHGRIAAHREAPEPVPFVVYERVSARFFPVPTRPVFEPATATYAAYSSPAAGPGYRITPPLGVTPSPFGPPAPPTNAESVAPQPKAEPKGESPADETLPRPLPSMEALPLPQPETGLPPAPRLDDP